MRAFVPKSASMVRSSSSIKRKRYILILSILLLLIPIILIGVVLVKLAEPGKEVPKRVRPLAQTAEGASGSGTGETQRDSKYSILSLLNEDTLIDAYIDESTTNGRDTVTDIASIRSSGQINWYGDSHDFTLTKRLPDQMRLELKSADSIATYGFDGRSYWQDTDTDSRQSDSSAVSTAETVALRHLAKFFDPILAYAMVGAGVIQVIEIDEWRGTSAVRVQLRGTNLSRIDVYLDPDNLKILATVERLRDSGDEYTSIFSDYQSIDGLRVPLKIQHLRGEDLLYELTADTWVANPEVTASSFEAPRE